MPNYSIHCVECDSQRVVMYNAICTWDVSENKWVYSENYDPMYQCSDCGNDSNEIIEYDNEDGSDPYENDPMMDSIAKEIVRERNNA